MGKFTNTVRKDTIDSLLHGFKEKIKNPYYMHLDKKPNIVDYYSQNIEASTLDDGLKIAESQVGDDSPFKYNLIKDFYLYGGIEQVQIQLDNSEFGLEADTITGSSIVLPNTIIPTPGDIFKLTYLDKPYLFKVISVNVDTIESGANFYKVEYEFYRKDDSDLLPLVKDNYVMIITNVGTKFTPIIKRTEYDYIDIMEEITSKLKQYYKCLFYTPRVETLILQYMNTRFYDPYIVEFIIRNELLSDDGEKFVYLTQQVSLPSTFSLDYDNTLYKALENKSIKRINNNKSHVYGVYIDQPLSLLAMRKEEYFMLKYINKEQVFSNQKFEIFSEELISKIKNNQIYTETIIQPDEVLSMLDVEEPDPIDPDPTDPDPTEPDPIEPDPTEPIGPVVIPLTTEQQMYNIIIKYFNNSEIEIHDITNMENIDYEHGLFLFHYLPIIIFIMQESVKIKLLKNKR